MVPHERTNMKVQYAVKAFTTNQVERCKRVTRHFPKLNLSFLDKDKSESKEDQPLAELGSTSSNSTPTAATEDAS